MWRAALDDEDPGSAMPWRNVDVDESSCLFGGSFSGSYRPVCAVSIDSPECYLGSGGARFVWELIQLGFRRISY
jgi:hypothetical protein